MTAPRSNLVIELPDPPELIAPEEGAVLMSDTVFEWLEPAQVSLHVVSTPRTLVYALTESDRTQPFVQASTALQPGEAATCTVFSLPTHASVDVATAQGFMESWLTSTDSAIQGPSRGDDRRACAERRNSNAP